MKFVYLKKIFRNTIPTGMCLTWIIQLLKSTETIQLKEQHFKIYKQTNVYNQNFCLFSNRERLKEMRKNSKKNAYKNQGEAITLSV